MTPLAASTFVWVFILLPLVVIWVIGVVDILRRDLSRQATVAWILIVLLLPLAGTLLYFWLRKPTQDELRRAQAAGSDGSRGHGRTDVGPRPPVD